MTSKADISSPCPRWPNLSHPIHQALDQARDMAGINKDAGLSIVLADDMFVQNLNREYRGKNTPTNVLSFPQNEASELGDIVLAYETVANEAEQQGKTLENHALHLIIHGLLHLAGHDHEEDQEAETMETLEIKILAELGIKNPYEAGDFVS